MRYKMLTVKGPCTHKSSCCQDRTVIAIESDCADSEELNGHKGTWKVLHSTKPWIELNLDAQGRTEEQMRSVMNALHRRAGAKLLSHVLTEADALIELLQAAQEGEHVYEQVMLKQQR